MPVYNASKFLEETIDSIINQSFQDWELIAVDDFSTDDSLSILANYADADHRIKVERNDSKGIIPALEKAYSFTKGTFITRMDADDIMPNDKLRHLLNVLKLNPSTCATGYVEYFSEDQVYDGYKRYADWLNNLVDHQNHYDDIYKECVVASPCWMMHRDTLDKIGGITSDRYPEDYDLIFRLYQYNIPIVGVKEVLHLWRDHGSRASRNDSNYADQAFLDLKIHYFKLLEYKSDKEIILWGAGGAGKSMAKKMQKADIPFRWVTNNEKKIGLDIYDVRIESTKLLQNTTGSAIILAVKQRNFKESNKAIIEKLNKENELFLFY